LLFERGSAYGRARHHDGSPERLRLLYDLSRRLATFNELDDVLRHATGTIDCARRRRRAQPARLAGMVLTAAGVLMVGGASFAVLARALPVGAILAPPGLWVGVGSVVTGMAVLRSARMR
jgi:hypothetical protein